MESTDGEVGSVKPGYGEEYRDKFKSLTTLVELGYQSNSRPEAQH
jgi:hypothetical protein